MRNYKGTDWDYEFELLKQYLNYKIDNHINIIKETDKIDEPSFPQRTVGTRMIIDYKNGELNFEQWKIYTINKIPFKKPRKYWI